MASPPHNELGSRTELARRFVESLVNGTAIDVRPTFDYTALQGLTVVEVAEGRIVCEMPVSDRVQNRYGTLHGGATATLVDTISTAALLTVSPHSGVSVHLAVTYLAPMPGRNTAPVGGDGGRGGSYADAAAASAVGGGADSDASSSNVESVVVDARVTRVGRQLASLDVQLRRKSTGQLVATGTHTKFLQVADPAVVRMRGRVAGQGGQTGRSEGRMDEGTQVHGRKRECEDADGGRRGNEEGKGLGRRGLQLRSMM